MSTERKPTKGDTVIYKDRNGFTHYGIVDSAINYGSASEPDWYVEGHTQAPRSAFYIKQKIDGLETVQFRPAV